MVTALERVAAERHESFRQAPEHRVDRVESYRWVRFDADVICIEVMI